MKVWNWEGFWSYFTNLYLLEGALWTIGLTISTLILGGLLGLVLAVMRLSKHKAVSRTADIKFIGPVVAASPTPSDIANASPVVGQSFVRTTTIARNGSSSTASASTPSTARHS